ncbi:MAG TPA: flavin reductase family protein [Streptomyces sp.]|uniref:flavin reductase family protein n=1 Tax=Streptomyces sp. TaxID=1931 RepID=UPI002BE2B1C5|nr:flavin reductase family protein [Streptomyces sp.]HWU06503.1 flavin reductase family protein [Streptomyces sp.]
MLISEPRAVAPAEYRRVMGHHPTGVSVVTGMRDGAPVGMVVGTFSAVSMDPPLVSFMPTVASGTYTLLREAGSFCINVLAADQMELCRTMAVPRPDKFDGVPWTVSPFGAPRLAGAVAYVDCAPEQEVPAGDHWITLCRVQAMEIGREASPLVFFQGGYGEFARAGRADAELHEYLAHYSDFAM